MEIIMKVKCSPNPGTGSPGQPSLKIVDQHHQLQQHTGYNSTNATSPQIATYNIPPLPSNVGSECSTATSSCAECNVGYCCNLPACCITSPTATPHHLPTPPPLLPLQQTSSYAPTNLNQQANEDQLPEFVSIDDEKVKEYLMKFGQQQLEQQRKQLQQQEQQQQQQHHQQQHLQQQQQKQPQQREPSKVTRVFSLPSTSENRSRPVVYEIIELDDEGEREKLKQIKQQAEQRLATKKSTLPSIDINYAARHTKSLNISLIPKSPEDIRKQQQTETMRSSSQQLPPKLVPSQSKSNSSSNQKIIAEISLIDSSDEESSKDDDDEGDEDDLPLVAVSCELQCDDDDDDDERNDSTFMQNPSYSNLQLSRPRTIVQSKSPRGAEYGFDNEQNNEHLLVRWEEYEGQRERVFFECFLCGKKVQSSYNLRRHMMIHTGERPFGCDMCDRKFREFSDLKKHRRRHSNEPNFICMICREYPPIESDSTRCINCCTQSKNAVLEASIKMNEEKITPDVDTAQQSRDLTSVSPLLNPLSTTPTTPDIRTENFTTISPPLNYSSPSAPTRPASSHSSPHDDTMDNEQTFPNNSTRSDDAQRLLDNIPAVHRPGYNQLGMITRKEFPCPLCNRAFGTRHNLKRHYMIHTGEKPFSCSKCRKPFREYSTLKKHMVTHQRDRWYKCMQCPMKFRDFIRYTEHKASHPTQGENDGRTKSYNRYQSGDSYMDSNEEDSNSDDFLECCECGQRFNEIDAYNDHLKEHATTYQCYICKDHFETRHALEQHLALKHKRDTDSEDDVM